MHTGFENLQVFVVDSGYTADLTFIFLFFFTRWLWADGLIELTFFFYVLTLLVLISWTGQDRQTDFACRPKGLMGSI